MTETATLRHVRRGVDYVLITVNGDLDEETAPQVRTAVKAFRAAERGPLVIDLTNAVVHGRRGLSPLVNAFFESRTIAVDMYLIAPSPMVARVLGGINGEPLPTFATVAELEQALTLEEVAL